MTNLDERTRHSLDALSPQRDEAGDWAAILAATRRRRGPRVSAVVLAAGAIAAGVLLWPSSHERGGVVERALAAVGDGPVLHVVLEGSWGGELVSLSTGARTRVPGTTELWYDHERNLIRSVSRVGENVQSDETYRPGRRADDIAALGEQYREALESGAARVFGDGTVGGKPVYWIVVHREDLPAVADGRSHVWTQQVAISKETFAVVATRETRDGVESSGTRQLVRSLEFASTDSASFGDVDSGLSAAAMYYSPGYGGPRLTLGEARELLGRPLLWAGPEVAGLPLARIVKEEMGRYDPATRTRDGAVGIGTRDGAVGIGFVYGGFTGVDRYGDPVFKGAHVIVRETAASLTAFTMGNEYVPPPGVAFVGPNSVLVHRESLYVRIEGSDVKLRLAAARALEPVR